MVELRPDRLIFSFPEVHPHAVRVVNFQRTLRIPDDGRHYPLPPGLGRFPLEHVEDHAGRLPASWREHGGVLLPMYQAEALWLNFSDGWDGHDDEGYPFAVKVAAGKINAVTGEPWTNQLSRDPQDYLVTPEQPWLDGFCVRKGLIRQFVAMPLGHGYTAEEQLTGAAEYGGIQIIVYPARREFYEELVRRREEVRRARTQFESALERLNELRRGREESVASLRLSDSMGFAFGGLMRQEIYEDPYRFNIWETEVSSRCFVHVLNSGQWLAATGKPAPTTPPSAADYTKAGLPWFDYYDDQLTALDGSQRLEGLDSVAVTGIKKGEQPLAESTSVESKKVGKPGRRTKRVSHVRK
jgi:hypothetical protein